MIQQNIGNGLDQTWSAYKNGFNDGTGGYWIGNENLYRLTNNGTTCRLCIDMWTTEGSILIASYTSFVVGKETDGYNYTASGFDGKALVSVDAFGQSNSFYKFNAKDQNNQPGCTNYASSLRGGWWYPCSAPQTVLNGVGSTGFFWTDTPSNQFLKASCMWIYCP